MISTSGLVRSGTALLLGAAAFLVAAHDAAAATGRDINAGYRFIDSADGATPGAGFFDGPVTTLNPADDTVTGPIDMGFAAGFPYYGTSPTLCWISDNGWISFSAPPDAAPVPPADIPLADPPNEVVAPFWVDLLCSNAGAGQSIRYGRLNSQGAFRIQWSGVVEATGTQVLFDLYLFSDGRMKFHYLAPADPAATGAVGIENAAGDDGIKIAAAGSRADGVPAAFAGNYVIDFFPPPVLVALCPSIPEITCGSLNDSLPDALPGNIQTYGCGAATAGANEKVYSFVLTEPSIVTATLTAGTATNLRLYLLDSCDETSCLRGPSLTSITSVLLARGRYYIVVDAAAQTDEGTYTLDLACTPLATPITCGDVVAGDTNGLTNRFPTSPCVTGRSLSGPEAYYHLVSATATNIQAALSGFTADLDVLILRATPNGEITATDCIAWGDTATVAWDAPADDYLIVVDGFSSAADRFTLTTGCGVDMDCTTLAGTVDMGGGRRQVISGDTATGANSAELYRCDLARAYDGPEIVYELIMPSPGQIAIRQTAGAAGLAFFVLDSCNEGSCLGIATEGLGCGTQLGAGTHYIVVDGLAGASGAFDAEIVYEEQFNRWTSCEDPGGGTSVGDTSKTEWNFQDDWYCIGDPRSRNYPGGCIFAMYITAWCGTEMHLPLWDVEGGHVRIFDVFGGAYVDLTAESPGGYRDTGDEIRWEDCTGTDAQWNNKTTDIWFQRIEGLCGIYRVEFINHSGNVWDLFANCSGTNTPQFFIHDNLCAALSDYNPLPNVALVSATPVYNCPDVTVTYEVRNDGCAPANDILIELTDAGVVVQSELIPQLLAGETITLVMNARFTGTDTNGVLISVDPHDTLEECIEVENAACAVQAGDDVIVLPDCSTTCQVSAVATLDPRRACEGDTVDIDASGAVSVNCTGGILEYQLIGPGGPSAWQLSPNFTVTAPGGSTDYTVGVRCADPTLADTCVDQFALNLPVDLRPILDPASVTVADPCDDGIVLNWGAATWRGPAGAGYYNIYRSTTSCADAVAAPAFRSGLFVTTFTDGTTVAGTTYYYVIEAEDGTGNSACVPAGPTVRGSTTRVDAPGGTCVGVVDGRGQDPATLPRVGASLRAGGSDPGVPRLYGPDFVTLRWTTDVPLDPVAGQHFHVERSSAPDTGFARINTEPPFLTIGEFTDTNAAQPDTGIPIFFYLVFTSDGCEVDNRDFDNFRTIP